MSTQQLLALRRLLQPYAMSLAVFALASIGLGFSPSAPMVVTLLAVLLVNARSASGPTLAARTLRPAAGLVLGLTLAYFKTIHGALRSVSHTIVTLGLLACLLSAVALALVGGSVWLASRPLHQRTPVARLLLFPTIWASGWALLGLVSPLGRQAAWTPLEGALLDLNVVLVPVFGPPVVDFTIALVAGVLAESVLRLAGPNDGALSTAPATSAQESLYLSASDDDILLVDDPNASSTSEWSPLLPSPSANGTSPNHIRESEASRPPAALGNGLVLSNHVLITVASLLFGVLGLLSAFAPGPPLSVDPLETHTPLSVACVLPPRPRANDETSALDRYIAESRRHVSSATVLLWPEEAVSLSSDADWSQMIASVGDVARHGGAWIAVGFAGPDGSEGLRRNAVVMVGPKGEIIGEYKKQHRVPIAESFSIAHHTQTPPVLMLDLPHPQHVAKSTWSTSELDYRRPTSATFVICNDLNFPDLLADSRSTLTLVPSSTWYPSVGLSLLAQARSRALETAAPLVLCDSGGDGRSAGVSGFVDRSGHVRQFQVGGGSFVVHVSLDRYTPDGPRTPFQSLTEAGVASLLLLFWALAALIEFEMRHDAGGECRLGRLAFWVWRTGREWVAAARVRLTGGGATGALLV